MNDHLIPPPERDRAPVVIAKNGVVFADSRDVAQVFNREHKSVLRSISDLGCSPEFRQRNFAPSSYRNDQGREMPFYMLTRDGFAFLVMGFTGGEADRWKERYIEAFNWMEAELRNRPAPDLNDPVALRGLLLTYSEKVLALEKANADMQPKVEALDRLSGAAGSMCISTAAKTLGVNPIKNLFAFLQARRWIFKRPNTSGWLAHQDKIQSGYLEHADHLYIDSLGQERVNSQVKVTAKGLVKIADLLTQRPQ